jgi:hypothetical protein
MVITTWGMSRIGGYRQVEEKKDGGAGAENFLAISLSMTY